MESVVKVDVVVVGGGPAGLSAALCLGRARQNVAVIDAGAPRHAVAEGVNNFVTRDGIPPAEFRRVAWEQLAKYPSVKRYDGVVTSVEHTETSVMVQSEGVAFHAQALLLAVGVVDVFPEIEGFDEHWGSSIFLCPFCHGWEVQDQRFGLLSNVPAEMYPMMRAMFGNWTSDLTFFTNGGEGGDVGDAKLITTPVARFVGRDGKLTGVETEDGQVTPIDAVFFHGTQRQVPLVEALGLELDEQGYVKVDATQKTSVDRIWAAGDLTGQMTQQVVQAAAQGSMAGAMIFKDLLGLRWG